MKQSFTKEERLTGKRTIEALVNKGKRRKVDFINTQSLIFDISRTPPIKVLFAVPKRKFSRAVDRNLLKRRMREAYRKNKNNLIEHVTNCNKCMDIMIVYSSSEIKEYLEIENKIILLLKGFLDLDERNP